MRLPTARGTCKTWSWPSSRSSDVHDTVSLTLGCQTTGREKRAGWGRRKRKMCREPTAGSLMNESCFRLPTPFPRPCREQSPLPPFPISAGRHELGQKQGVDGLIVDGRLGNLPGRFVGVAPGVPGGVPVAVRLHGGLAMGRGNPIHGEELVGAANQVAGRRAIAAGLAVVERRAVVEPLVVNLADAPMGAGVGHVAQEAERQRIAAVDEMEITGHLLAVGRVMFTVQAQ